MFRTYYGDILPINTSISPRQLPSSRRHAWSRGKSVSAHAHASDEERDAPMIPHAERAPAFPVLSDSSSPPRPRSSSPCLAHERPAQPLAAECTHRVNHQCTAVREEIQSVSCEQRKGSERCAPDNAQRAIEGNEGVLKVESSDALGVRRDVTQVANVPV